MNNRLFIPALVFLAGRNLLFSQVDFWAEPVSVTSSRLSTRIASETREVIVIKKEEIETIPAESIPDILRISGVDVSRRGHGSVQTDLSLRGGSFEQVLILLDGMRMNNPQTGHFNFDLPVSVSDIERIEILPGHSASILGPDGYNGVVHIITRSGAGKESTVEMTGGSFGSFAISGSQTIRIGSWNHRISAGKQISEGFRDETDYDIGQFYSYHKLQLNRSVLFGSLGWSNRDYGANGFYAPYPSRETTEAWTGQAMMKTQHSSGFATLIRFSARQHEDDFILDADRPAWYQNHHQTRTFAGEVQSHLKLTNRTELVMGLERRVQVMASTRLGEHDRTQTGLFSEWAHYSANKWIINLSARLDGYEGVRFQLNPSASLSIPMMQGLKWRVSAGRAYRGPSFTELYYDSPANQGDPNLKPEQAWSAETGLNGQIPTLQGKMTAFIRLEQNRIDWINDPESSVWHAGNRESSNVQGLSFRINWHPTSGLQTRIHWQEFLRSESSSNLQYSKYGFNAAQRLLRLSNTIALFLGIRQQLEVSYKQREITDEILLVDIGWYRSWKRFTLNFDVFNLLDRTYEEIPGVPMPGRHINIGARIQP